MEGDVRSMTVNADQLNRWLREKEKYRVRYGHSAPFAGGKVNVNVNGNDLTNHIRSVTVKQKPQRPIHCPSWLEDDEVVIVGTGQKWKVTSAEWRVRAGDVQEMTLELISVGQSDQERQRRDALEDAPADVRECLKALYELEDALPPEKEAIVELTPDPPNRDRYTLRVVDRDSQ
jgi:hypothetical protein